MRSQVDAVIIKIQKYDGAMSTQGNDGTTETKGGGETKTTKGGDRTMNTKEVEEQWRLREVVVEGSQGCLGQDHQAVDQEENELENSH